MTEHIGLTELFNSYIETSEKQILVLQNRKHFPVASIFLENVRAESIVVHERLDWLTEDAADRYYIIVNGCAGIFFTYYRKSSRN